MVKKTCTRSHDIDRQERDTSLGKAAPGSIL